MALQDLEIERAPVDVTLDVRLEGERHLVARAQQRVQVDSGHASQRQGDAARGQETLDLQGARLAGVLQVERAVPGGVDLVGGLAPVSAAAGDEGPVAARGLGEEGDFLGRQDALGAGQADPVVGVEDVEEGRAVGRVFEGLCPLRDPGGVGAVEGVQDQRGEGEVVDELRLVGPVAEVRHVLGVGDVRLGEESHHGRRHVQDLAEELDDGVRLLEAGARRAALLPQVGDGVETHQIGTPLHVEEQRLQGRQQDARVAVVEVDLVAREGGPDPERAVERVERREHVTGARPAQRLSLRRAQLVVRAEAQRVVGEIRVAAEHLLEGGAAGAGVVENAVEHQTMRLSEASDVLPGAAPRVHGVEVDDGEAPVRGVGEKRQDVEDAERRFALAQRGQQLAERGQAGLVPGADHVAVADQHQVLLAEPLAAVEPPLRLAQGVGLVGAVDTDEPLQLGKDPLGQLVPVEGLQPGPQPLPLRLRQRVGRPREVRLVEVVEAPPAGPLRRQAHGHDSVSLNEIPVALPERSPSVPCGGPRSFVAVPCQGGTPLFQAARAIRWAATGVVR
jgi:hypothetical protein